MSSPVLEYLTNVLSQRGPNSVPYDENVKWNIRDHVSELQKVFPTLTSKLSEYHGNDGRHFHLLKVEGTIPIHFQGAKYNIPVLMWLTEHYPFMAPQVYVMPTANMMIRASDKVDSSGQVTTHLIRNWIFPSSNLVDVVLEMSQRFSEEPPLYTRPAGYAPPPTAHGPAVAQPPPSYPQPGSLAGPSPAAAKAGGGAGSYSNMHYPGIQASTVGTLTPYATPSVGNTPGSTPGAAPGPELAGSGWGAAAATTAACPSGGYPPASGPVQPPPPPPPPASGFGLGSMIFGGFLGGGGHQQQQQPAPPPPPPLQSSGPSGSQYAPPPPPAAVAPPPQAKPPPPPPAEPHRPPVSKEELDVHFRHLVIEALSSQLRALQRGFSEYAQEETVKALEEQNQLSERRTQLQALHDSLTNERMGTEQLVGELASKTKALQSWLERNEPLAAKYDPATSPISSHLLPLDELCRQGMETQARDLALEDAILALDKLLQTGQLPLDVYLKQVRALCRKQFFSRALGLKVAAVQQQQQQASSSGGGRPPAMRPSPGFQTTTTPYSIAHGDGWSHGSAPAEGLQTPGPLLQALGSGSSRFPTSVGPGQGPGPGLRSPGTGMLTNPLAGR